MKQSYIYLKDALQDTYKNAFEKVEAYGTTHLISGEIQEERLMELLDNLLAAQKEQKDVSAIVGGDIDTFCRNFYGDYKVQDRVKDFPKYLSGIAWAIFIFSIIDFVFNFSDGSRMSDTMGGFTVGMIGGCGIELVIYLVIRPFYLKSKNAKLVNKMLPIFCVAALIITILVGAGVTKYITIQVPILLEVVVSGTYLAIYYAVRCVLNKRCYGTLFAPRVEEISFEEALNTSSMYTMPDAWLKGFRRKNSRLKKNGKPGITEEEYLNEIGKSINYKKNHIINLVILGGIGLCAILTTAISNGPEMLVDSMIFALILFFVEALVCRFMDKIIRNTDYVFCDMRKKMEEEQLSLSEYVDRIHNRE